MLNAKLLAATSGVIPISYVDNSNSGSSNASFSSNVCTIPLVTSGIQTGDLYIVSVFTGNNGYTFSSVTSGWTVIYSDSPGTPDIGGCIAYKFVTGGEGSSMTVTGTGTFGSGSSSCVVFRGVSAIGNYNGQYSTNPTVTPQGGDSAAVFICCDESSSNVDIPAPSGYTEIFDTTYATTTAKQHAISYDLDPANFSPNITMTGRYAMLIELKE